MPVAPEPRAAPAHQPDLEHGFFNDGADVEAIALPYPRIGDAPAALLVLFDARETFVGLQRVAAGGDEIDHVVEIGSRQRGVWRRCQHFRVEFVGEKRFAAGAAEHVLRQHVERAGTQRRRILRILRDRVDRDPAFQHLEAIGGNEHGARGLVEPVVGAADPLHQARGTLGRADIDDEIDVAPIDTEIERGGADHAAQLSCRHRVLDLAALGDVERAVMQRDGEAVVVHAPEILEQHFGLAAGVDENQRGLVALDQVIHFTERMARGVAGPWQSFFGVEHLDHRRRGAAGHDDIGRHFLALALRHQKPRQRFRLGHRCGQADRAHLRRQPPQPRQAERQQIAALGGDERMQLVEHDAFERGEQKRRVVRRQQQRQLFRRGEQDVRRIAPLPLPPRHRRIAGAGLDLDRQPHLGNRRLQIARDIDGQRLQRRDVEGVQAAGALHAAAGGDEVLLAAAFRSGGRRKAPPASAETRQRLAGAGRRNQQRRAVVAGLCQQRQLMLARRPAARGEPVPEAVRQQRSRFKRRERVGDRATAPAKS